MSGAEVQGHRQEQLTQTLIVCIEENKPVIFIPNIGGPWPPLAPFTTPLVGSISTIGLTLMGHQMPWLLPAYIFNQADEFMWGIL